MLWSGGFKPYYNWNTFNTLKLLPTFTSDTSFKPYYNWNTFNTQLAKVIATVFTFCFKPYYNWNTFNTNWLFCYDRINTMVLNLIITGIPSILGFGVAGVVGVSVLNLIITGIPSILQMKQISLILTVLF